MTRDESTGGEGLLASREKIQIRLPMMGDTAATGQDTGRDTYEGLLLLQQQTSNNKIISYSNNSGEKRSEPQPQTNG